MTNVHDAELDHRLRKAWTKYSIFKQELTDKAVPISLRLKLFHSVITPTALYGCGSWVMTSARQATLRSAQLKMLRSILGLRRIQMPNGDIETWVDWVQRATNNVCHLMDVHCIPSWTDEQISRTSRWRERLEHMTYERWAKQVFEWMPDGCRRRGHPIARWADAELSPSGT